MPTSNSGVDQSDLPKWELAVADPGRSLLSRPPRCVVLTLLCLGLIEPLSHVLVAHFPPAGTAFSGGHTVDTVIYLTSMRHAHPPWYSPYALCGDPTVGGDSSLYPIPYHYLFGAIGAVGRVAGLPEFHVLGIANGLCLAFYLYAVYCFFTVAAPRLARRAFFLFAVGGGLGGLLYLVTWPWGVHDHPDFGRYFLRYFIYELSEGPRFQPWLMAARLYYTLPMGLGFFGLAILSHRLQAPAMDEVALGADRLPGWRRGAVAPLAAAALCFALASLINFRVGPMLWAAGALVAFCHDHRPWRSRLGWAAGTFLGMAAGTGVALWSVSRSPEFIESARQFQRNAVWFSPIVSTTFFYWFLVPRAVSPALKQAPRLLQVAGWYALGYIVAFAGLYGAYQAYYGNLLITGEFNVAVLISDYALALGILPAGFFAWRNRQHNHTPSAAAAPPWTALWLLAFFALSISAWGQGAYLRLAPDRFIVVIGAPLALLGAAALERGILSHPILYRGLQTAILGCGLLSIGVTWLVSYGPLGYHTIQRHYSWTRVAFISEADAHTLEHARDGRILAPAAGAPLFGDVAVLQDAAAVIGVGTLDYSRRVAPALRAEVARFFDPATSEGWRHEKVREWCVDFVYCPDMDPIDPSVIAQLQAYGWLRTVAAEGQALLFSVR